MKSNRRPAASDAPLVEVRQRSDLRNWLSENADSSESVWLVTWKKGTPHYVPFAEYVEELLCWGWIDSVPRKVDVQRSATLISRRHPNSAWSAINKDLVEQARSSGALTRAGEEAIERAKKNGTWTFLDDVEALIVPEDLASALGARLETWDNWPRSYKRAWLEKIKRAKTAPTREKRIVACTGAVLADDPKRGLS